MSMRIRQTPLSLLLNLKQQIYLQIFVARYQLEFVFDYSRIKLQSLEVLQTSLSSKSVHCSDLKTEVNSTR